VALAGPVASEMQEVRPFDFRRPQKLSRDELRRVSAIHEQVVRGYAGALTSTLRRVTTIEALSSDQITYEDYVRSVPNPSVLASFRLAPLEGVLVVELGAELALTVIDRLLGGPGQPVGLRPTELEQDLLRGLISRIALPLAEALAPLIEVTPELVGIELNAQFLEVASASDVMLLHTSRLTMSGESPTEGILAVCWPIELLQEVFADRAVGRDGHGGAEGYGGRLDTDVMDDVELRIRLHRSSLAVSELASLAIGDVIRLDHRVDEAAAAEVGGTPILRGQRGRRGRRLAIRFDGQVTT
jgi:flagellar motor switch protein FliM